MLTRRMDEKIEELKTFFNSKLEEKLGEQEKNLTNTLNNLISDLRNEFKKELQNEINKQYVKLESENKMLRKQVSELHKLNIENQTNNEDLEQYGRRLCLRIDGVPVVENETSVNVLASVKKLFDDAQVEIPDAVIDRAHRIGGKYVDRKSKKSCKSIIVRCIDLIFTNQENLSVNSGFHASLHPNCHHQIVHSSFNLNIYYPPPYQ